MKDKSSELDHHPEWNIKNNLVNVKLTSHFMGNNVSEKDYELAANFSVAYDKCHGLFNNQAYLSYLIGTGLVSVFCLVGFYVYEFKKNYRYTSMDFMFARIETADNNYVKKNFSNYN